MTYLYSDFITDLRADVGDFAIPRFETADGDASTSRFQLANAKIQENSLVVQISGVTQPLTTNYTILADIAQVLFTNGHIPASGNDNVSFQYNSVNLLDADYVNIINQVLSQLRRKLWIEFEDQTTLTSVIDQNNYSLATVKSNGGFTDIIFITDFEYQLATNSPADPTQQQQVTNPWRSVGTVTNVRFYKDLQEIRIRPAFNSASFPMRIKGSRAYVQGTASTSTFELQTRYWPAVKKFCHAIYLERMAMALIKEMSAVSKEKTYENATEMRKLAIDVRNEAVQMLKEVRPSKPAKMIPTIILGMNV